MNGGWSTENGIIHTFFEYQTFLFGTAVCNDIKKKSNDKGEGGGEERNEIIVLEHFLCFLFQSDFMREEKK